MVGIPSLPFLLWLREGEKATLLDDNLKRGIPIVLSSSGNQEVNIAFCSSNNIVCLKYPRSVDYALSGLLGPLIMGRMSSET